MQACQSNEVSIQQCLSYLDRMILDIKRYNINDFDSLECYAISSMLENISNRYNAEYLYHDLIWKSDNNFSIKSYLQNVNKKQLQKQIELILIRKF